MATGTADLNFGAFPGASDASVAVTEQGSIASDSLVEAWIRPVATANHSADEHLVENLKVIAGNIVAGTGFTIYGFNTTPHFGGGESLDGNYNVRPTNSSRLYGIWKVNWAWV